MKRLELTPHLERHGCELLREGAKHSVYVNRTKKKSSTVPRHREASDLLAQKDLQGSRGRGSVTSTLPTEAAHAVR